jgi:alpha-L-fucosidase
VPPAGLASIAAMNGWHDARDGQWLESAPPRNPLFVRNWLLRQNQMVDRYRPDIVYFDNYAIPFGATGLAAVAHYYNQSIARDGQLEVVLTAGRLDPLQEQAVTWNVERGYLDAIHPRPWQTATCIGNWHYDRPLYERDGYKSAQSVLQRLVDVVSKNGNLLLNIPLRGDGTIDDKEEAIIDAIAAWMARNGAAIFGTRPWQKFGEGPTRPPSGAMAEDQVKPFTADDIRFTAGGGLLHAFFMDRPAAPARILSLGGNALPDAVIDQLLFEDGRPLQFRRDADALTVVLPPALSLVPRISLRGRGLV